MIKTKENIASKIKLEKSIIKDQNKDKQNKLVREYKDEKILRINRENKSQNQKVSKDYENNAKFKDNTNIKNKLSQYNQLANEKKDMRLKMKKGLDKKQVIFDKINNL